MKLDVTQEAIKALKDVLKGKNEDAKAVRVSVAGYSWGGPRMGLVLDEQKDTDEVFIMDDLTFVVGEDLDQFEGFKVDYMDSFLRKGFVVNVMGFASGSC